MQKYVAGLLACGAAVPWGASSVAASPLPTWNFTYTYNGQPYTDTFVGTNPASGPVTTTVPVYLFPVALTYGGFTADPTGQVKGLPKGATVITSTAASPLFSTGVDFQADGTDIGNTQYTDAFQKMSLWTPGGSATGYHVLLGQSKIQKVLKLTVPKNKGALGRPLGGIKVIEADIDWFDQQIRADLSKHNMPANALAIFITTQTYLTESGACCIGGYHAVTSSGLTYTAATYIVAAGNAAIFAQDVSALSGEIATWLTNPFATNNSPCGAYDVGYGAYGEPNYGNFPYKLGGITYHLHDAATPAYFGAPPGYPLGGYFSFQGNKLTVCEGSP
jgi:hypothetical protein